MNVSYTDMTVEAQTVTAGVANPTAFSFVYNGVLSPLMVYDVTSPADFAAQVTLHCFIGDSAQLSTACIAQKTKSWTPLQRCWV